MTFTGSTIRNFITKLQNCQATTPKVLPIEVNEEGEVILSTQWIVDVIGLDWQIPEGFEMFQVTPQNPVQMITGMNEFYQS